MLKQNLYLLGALLCLGCAEVPILAPADSVTNEGVRPSKSSPSNSEVRESSPQDPSFETPTPTLPNSKGPDSPPPQIISQPPTPPSLPSPSSPKERFVERHGSIQFYQPEARSGFKKLDLLFVADSSGSLIEERQATAKGLLHFLAEIPDGVDYQVGLIEAHVGKRTGQLKAPYRSPKVLSSLTSSSQEIQRRFRSRISTVDSESETDGGEAGIISLMNFLKGSDRSLLVRDDSLFVVIFISDENDLCSRYLEQEKQIRFVEDAEHDREGTPLETIAYAKHCLDEAGKPKYRTNRVKADLKAILPKNEVLVSGVLYTGENPVPKKGENEIGYGYLELIEATGGLAVDLADPPPDRNPNAPDYHRIATGLGQIGELARFYLTKLQREVRVPENIVWESLKVFVDARLVKFQSDPVNSLVHLLEAGEPSSQVRLDFLVREKRFE